MSMPAKRLLIVEEALKDSGGHWYEYDKAVIEMNRAEGIDVALAAHREIALEKLTDVQAIPLFPRSSWDTVCAHPAAWMRYADIAKHNMMIYKVAGGYLRKSQPFDCVFVPTVAIHHLAAWLFLIRRFRKSKIRRLVLLFRNNVGYYESGLPKPKFARHTAVFREILKAYRPYLGSVCLATDSGRLAEEYRALSGMALTVFPSPRIWPSVVERPQASEGPVTMACLGPARHEKGIDILMRAIREHATRYPKDHVRYFIQWGENVTGSDGSKLDTQDDLKNVFYIHGSLTSLSYKDYFEKTDCMILPYRRESYFARISGLGLEALTAGIPVIYTCDTWMEDSVKTYGAGIGLKNPDPAELAESIHRMILNIDGYRRAAAENAVTARKYHSPDKFMKCLWGARWH